jgi:hypothetical protein
MKTTIHIAALLIVVLGFCISLDSKGPQSTAGETRDTQSTSLSSNDVSLTVEDPPAPVLAATAVLERSPNLNPLPENALKEKEFIALAQSIVGYLHRPNQEAVLLVDAIEALESVIAEVGRPKATIKSTPAGWIVKYRGFVDYSKNRGTWQDVKTDSAPEVDPKQYIFRCFKQNGESCGERIRSCDTSANCIAEFP